MGAPVAAEAPRRCHGVKNRSLLLVVAAAPALAPPSTTPKADRAAGLPRLPRVAGKGWKQAVPPEPPLEGVAKEQRPRAVEAAAEAAVLQAARGRVASEPIAARAVA